MALLRFCIVAYKTRLRVLNDRRCRYLLKIFRENECAKVGMLLQKEYFLYLPELMSVDEEIKAWSKMKSQDCRRIISFYCSEKKKKINSVK